MKLFIFELGLFTVLSFTIETLFTAIADPIRGYCRGEKIDLRFKGHTHLWGIFVYGISAATSFLFVDRVVPEFYALHWAIRGTVYMIGIYAWEYFWGAVLERILGFCPWQYTKSRHAIWRYLNPRFFGFWFGFGFVLEWVHLELVPVLKHAFL